MPSRFYPRITATEARLRAREGVLGPCLDDLSGRIAWEASQGRYQLELCHAYVSDMGLGLAEREALTGFLEAHGYRCIWTDDDLIISWE